MNVRLVSVDPKKGAAAAVIYEYGEERYCDGLYSGAIYATLVFIFLFCVREYVRIRRN